MNETMQRVAQACRKNNMAVYFAETKDEIPGIVRDLLKHGDVISCGGSVTLSECGVTDLMKSGDYTFLDRSVPGLTADQIGEIYRQTFSCDAYFCSANAVTETGELVNVDGNSNRVAAILYGPKSVICIVGANKIVPDVTAAFERIRQVAAPLNAKRLHMNTPCAAAGHCCFPGAQPGTGCMSEDRICANYVVSGWQRNKDRIKLILCDEPLGY